MARIEGNIASGDVMQAMNAPDSTPLDERLAKDMHALVTEAAERVTFHRVELERWERTGRAAAAAINQIQTHDPVAQATPEHFFGEEKQATPYPAGL